MQLVHIELNEHTDDLTKTLINSLNKLCNLKVVYSDSINSSKQKLPVDIICDVGTSAETELEGIIEYNQFVIRVADLLADYIIEKYEYKFLYRIISNNYYYFNGEEKREILNYAINNSNRKDSILGELYYSRKKSIIVKKMLEYLKNSSNIILKGFVDFRLQEYSKELEEVVDKAVNDFMMEKEHREFIRLLKYFVDSQIPKIDLVHVIVDYDGSYVLLDESHNEIFDNNAEEVLRDIPEEITREDLLVSSLITIAPRKIILHRIDNLKNKDITKTINNVFVERVSTCHGCAICTKQLASRDGPEIFH